MERIDVLVGDHRVSLSNLEKVLYPKTGFTKGQVIDYYARIAPCILPHLQNHPITLKRYPGGVEAPFFYEKRCPRYCPDWVETASIWDSPSKARQIDYCLINNLSALVWAANLASLELHPSLSVASDISSPTALVFDLDPGAPAGLVECCAIALDLKSDAGGAEALRAL